MVTLFHANNYVLPATLYKDGSTAWAGFAMGYAGVEFFFVLSGFVMVFVHSADFGQPERAGRFLRKRILRIYPLYWLVLSILLAIYALESFTLGPAGASDPWLVLAAYLLWPLEDMHVMPLAWTLSHEMLFYLVFVVLIFSVRAGTAIFLVWMAGCFAGAVLAPLDWPRRFVFSPYNILFLFGMGAAAVWPKLGTGTARLILCAGLAAFFTVGFSEVLGGWQWHEGLRTLAYGVGAAAMVAGLAGGALPVPKWLLLLGDASYSLYLVHLPAMSLAVKLAHPLGAPWSLPPVVAIILVTAIAVITGVLVHLVVERPILSSAARLAGPRTPRVAA